MKNLSKLFLILSFLFSAGFTFADDFDKGLEFYVNKNYKEAIILFKKSATQGGINSGTSQSLLGQMYGQGLGVPKDYSESAKWYKRAAENGSRIDQDSLGFYYKNGTGVPQDDKQAVFWFKEAAKQNYSVSQYQLGLMYKNGRGVPKDNKEAVAWFLMAAKQRGPLEGSQQTNDRVQVSANSELAAIYAEDPTLNMAQVDSPVDVKTPEETRSQTSDTPGGTTNESAQTTRKNTAKTGMTLAEIRKQVPELAGLDDESAIDVIHQAHYPDMDRAEMVKNMGYVPSVPKEKQGEILEPQTTQTTQPTLAVNPGDYSNNRTSNVVGTVIVWLLLMGGLVGYFKMRKR